VETFLAIASRRDERRYRPRPVPAAVVERVLDAGRLSGSSRNGQPWTFVVPEARDRIELLAQAVHVPANITSAGLVVAILYLSWIAVARVALPALAAAGPGPKGGP